MPLYAFKDSWPEWNSAGFQDGILRAQLPQPRGFQPHAVLLSPWHNLSFVLVEIEHGIEFRLSQQQLLHARLVLERLVRLRGYSVLPSPCGLRTLERIRLIPSSIRDFDRGALTL